MKRTLLTIFWSIACTMVFAQATITVKGKVIDKDDKSGVPQATIQLLHLPDSTMVTGQVSDNDGLFSITAKPGNYAVKISFVGYVTQVVPAKLSKQKRMVDLGSIELASDAIMLKEAVVVGEATPVKAVEDTLVYAATAFRTPEGAALEELVKKLPGAEVDEEGNVTINGKTVKKLMMNGKEFMGGDVKTGLKNLPVEMVDKLKSYEKKSDYTRMTGIDDGEEETVLDLTVKKGMNKGWFGNLNLGAGNKERYNGRGMLSRFEDSSHLMFMGGSNNTGDRGFSGGGGGPRWGRNNGLVTRRNLNVSFAEESEKWEVGGSVRYGYTKTNARSIGSNENFRESGNSQFQNSNSINLSHANQLNADFRIEWRPDSMTTLLWRPNFAYNKNDKDGDSQSSTFNDDPYELVDNPNNYLDFEALQSVDPLRAIRLNASNNESLSKSHSLTGGSNIIVNRRLSSTGRNLTFNGSINVGNNGNDQYSDAETRYYQFDYNPDSTDYRKRFITSPGKNWSYAAGVSYSEPIAKATYLQFSYKFNYRYQDNDRSTYSLENMFPAWGIGQPLPMGYEQAFDPELSKTADYKYYSHNLETGVRFIRPKGRLSVSVMFLPQNTKLNYKKGDFATDTTRHIFNWAPRVEYQHKFTKQTVLNFNYRGRSTEPSMESLLPITDNSNPLNITVGNPGLKPSFAHNLELFFNSFNAEKQRGIITRAFATITQNAVSNSTRYNDENGGKITTPENINGNWNLFGMFGYNTALRDKRFTIHSFTRTNFRNNVAYLYNNQLMADQRNHTTNLTLAENLNGTFRNQWFDFSLLGSFEYNWERNELRPENNQEPYTFSYGASTNISFPWNMSLSTNISNQCRRGYYDESMNRNELIWNAQLAQTMLKGALTLSFQMNDILHNQSNISRALTAMSRSVNEYNSINSYCMLNVIYRLNVMGGKAAREKMMNGRGGGMHGPMGGGMMGGGRRF